MGDKFVNVNKSTIINRSNVSNPPPGSGSTSEPIQDGKLSEHFTVELKNLVANNDLNAVFKKLKEFFKEKEDSSALNDLIVTEASYRVLIERDQLSLVDRESFSLEMKKVYSALLFLIDGISK